MAAKKKRIAKKAATRRKAPEAVITGKVVMAPLSRVTPNGWNPNRMTEFLMKSTREGMRKKGWLAAYALLVWGTDRAGKRRDVIIDGEHRWRIARELGIQQGPMVFLDGLTEQQAKELTIELDNKRGRFDEVALRDLVGSLDQRDGLAFDLGFDDDSWKKLIAPSNAIPPGDFSSVDINAQTKYKCPKCSYEWTGGAAPSK